MGLEILAKARLTAIATDPDQSAPTGETPPESIAA
jgi:hypothetical protein